MLSPTQLFAIIVLQTWGYANKIYVYVKFITSADYVGFLSPSICLFVCPKHNSKTNDPKEFKLDTGNDFGKS